MKQIFSIINNGGINMPTNRKIAVIGLGYVGLTIANAFAQVQPVIGLDISKDRIKELLNGYDKNNELTKEELTSNQLTYTYNPDDIRDANFYIVTVLTPIDPDKRPNLSILLKASEMLGTYLKKGDVVVYESTVYPGATENKCIPVLEKSSNLICGKDFNVGYSPERINPGDTVHQFTTIPKIISANNPETLAIVKAVYSSVIKAPLFEASQIAVAEAAKVIENTQRDLNISIMNEFALFLHKLNIPSKEVFAAAGTKWNFLPFEPGLVGGHCIGVNSYYLTFRAEEVGFHPDLILAGRRVNEYMPTYIVETVIKELIKLNVNINGAKIGILGLTYKEDCPDLHFTKTLDVVRELKTYHTDLIANDPVADAKSAESIYNIPVVSLEEMKDMDAIILMLPHKQYLALGTDQIAAMLKPNRLIIDVKNILPKNISTPGVTIWSL